MKMVINKCMMYSKTTFVTVNPGMLSCVSNKIQNSKTTFVTVNPHHKGGYKKYVVIQKQLLLLLIDALFMLVFGAQQDSKTTFVTVNRQNILYGSLKNLFKNNFCYC